jgi:hypothetical protein
VKRLPVVIEGASEPPYSICLDPATATVKTDHRLMFVKRARPGTTDGYAWALNQTAARKASLAGLRPGAVPGAQILPGAARDEG